MRKTKRVTEIEDEYNTDIDVLLHELYEEEGLSQHEVADELGIPRSSLQYWLREAGVEMRQRTLSDVQRIGVLVLLPHLSSHRIAERVGCSTVTVRRYRRELEQTGSLPVNLNVELTEQDRDLLTPADASQWVSNPATNANADTTPPAATDGGDDTEPSATSDPTS